MKTQTQTAVSARRDRLLREHIHDPYKARSKLPEPTLCPVCKAVYLNGRWQWMDWPPEHCHQRVCQACTRIRDACPAGEILIRGAFAIQHKGEILRLADNQENQEKVEHPLHRIMNVHERAGTIRIETTDIHLPRRIGEALRRAHKGDLAINYENEGCFVRVSWTRN